MQRPLIEFCASNMHHGTDEVMTKLENDGQYEVIEYGCLGNCGECYMLPFALVNGEIISAEEAEQLYPTIVQALAAQQAHQEALDRLLDDM